MDLRFLCSGRPSRHSLGYIRRYPITQVSLLNSLFPWRSAPPRAASNPARGDIDVGTHPRTFIEESRGSAEKTAEYRGTSGGGPAQSAAKSTPNGKEMPASDNRVSGHPVRVPPTDGRPPRPAPVRKRPGSGPPPDVGDEDSGGRRLRRPPPHAAFYGRATAAGPSRVNDAVIGDVSLTSRRGKSPRGYDGGPSGRG